MTPQLTISELALSHLEPPYQTFWRKSLEIANSTALFTHGNERHLQLSYNAGELLLMHVYIAPDQEWTPDAVHLELLGDVLPDLVIESEHITFAEVVIAEGIIAMIDPNVVSEYINATSA